MALVAYPPAPAQGREHHALAQAYGIPSAVSPILAAAMAATAAMSGSAYPYLVSSKSSQPPWSGPASAAVEEAPLYSFTLEWPEEPQWKAMYTPLKGNNLLARIRRYQHPIDETMTTTKHWNRLTDLKSHLVRRHEMASKSRGLEPPPYVNATQYLRILKRRQNQQQQAVKPMAKLDQWMAMWNTLFPSESPPNRWHRGVPEQVSRFTVHGEVLGTSVSALPDTGADGCFISQALARRLRLSPRAGTERRVGVANGSDLHSPGSVEVPWTFFGETGTYHVTCWIIPTCGPDVDMILGQKFLQATSTTLRGPRVKKSFSSIPRSVSVRLLGEGKQRLWGRLNGDLVPALPDTGSDIMLLSKAYARKLGLYIDNSPDGVVEVEFPNGAREFTDGIVRNVLWSVGETSLRCDFYVLDNLCVDVILSKDYLFDHDVFAECKDHFTDDEATDHLLDLYGIRLLRTFGAALEQLADESIDDSKPFRPLQLTRRADTRSDIARRLQHCHGQPRMGAAGPHLRRDRKPPVGAAYASRGGGSRALSTVGRGES